MLKKPMFHAFTALAAILLLVGTAGAVTIATVPVGNAGNAGEWSGGSYGGYGPDRFCGAVDYDYSIGTYEVTAGQYCEFLNAVGGVDTYYLYNTSMWSNTYGCKIERYAGSGTVGNPYQYRVAEERANRPVNYVSWGDAARFCNWLENDQQSGAQDSSTTEAGTYTLNSATSSAALLAVTREENSQWAIPTEDEWYKAAYHKNDGLLAHYFDYPTSNDMAPGQDMADVSGNNANYYTAPDTYPIDSPYYTTVAGEFQNSESPYETYDQGGNVWEWNETLLPEYSSRGLRGGSFNYYSYDLLASTRSGYYYPYPTFEYSYIGFRVASVPEPGSLAMLAGVALMGLLYWRRKHA